MSERGSSDDRVEQMVAALLQRYGDRLGECEREDAREWMRAIVDASDAMRAVDLSGDDLPSVMPPYRKD